MQYVKGGEGGCSWSGAEWGLGFGRGSYPIEVSKDYSTLLCTLVVCRPLYVHTVHPQLRLGQSEHVMKHAAVMKTGKESRLHCLLNQKEG